MAVATDKILTQSATATLTAGTSGQFAIFANLVGDGAVAVDVGPTFALSRQKILNNIVSAQSETHGWNNERVNIPVTAVVRSSDTVVTITLPALSAYDITAQETITVTIPGGVLAGGVDIVATPTFTVDAGAGVVNVSGSLSGLGTVTARLIERGAILASLSGAGSASANILRGLGMSATLSGVGTFSGKASGRLPVSGTLVGVGTVSANTSVPLEFLNEFLSGNGTVAISLRQIWKTNTAVLSGIGTVSADVTGAGAIPQIGAALAGAGSLSVLLAEQAVVSALLSGAGTTSANILPALGAFASLSAVGAVFANTSKTAADRPQLAGVGSLNASLTPPRDLNAVLAGSGTVAVELREIWKTNPSLLAGIGTLFADARVAGQAQTLVGVLAGSGALAVEVIAKLALRASLAGVGSLSSAEGSLLMVRASLAGVGSLSARFEASQASAYLAGLGALSASAKFRGATSAILQGDGNFTAWTLAYEQARADFAGIGTVSADLRDASAFLRGTLSGEGTLRANVKNLLGVYPPESPNFVTLAAGTRRLGGDVESPEDGRIGPGSISTTTGRLGL